MLNILREQAKHLQWILWLIILSFVLLIFWQWGAGGGTGPGGGEAWAARVGDEVVPEMSFLRAFQRQEDQLRSMFGAQYERSRFMNPQAVLDGLVDRTVLLQEARAMGLQVPPEEIAGFIRNVKSFQDADGKFDAAALRAFLDATRQRPAEFEKDLAEDILYGKAESILGAASIVTDAQVREEWTRENNTVSIEYVAVPAVDLAASATVSEDAARARYDADPATWAGGPGRLVRHALFSRQGFQATLENEEEMRAYYEANKDAYTLGEDARSGRVILVAVDPAADALARATARSRADELARRARAGEDFAALARSSSDDEGTRGAGGYVGIAMRGAYDPSLEEAFYSMQPGEIRGPVETGRGFEIVKLSKGAGTQVEPFEDARDRVSRALYAVKATDAAQAAVTRFLEEYAKKQDFDAAATAAGVAASAPAWITEADRIPELDGSPLATQEAFQLSPGQVSKPVPLPSGQAILVVVESRESSPRTFEQARADVLLALRNEEGARAARAEADALLVAAQAAGSLDAARGSRELQTAAALRRGQAFVGSLMKAGPLVDAAFATPAQSFGPVVALESGAVVFRVTEKVEKSPDEDAAGLAVIRRRLETQRRNQLREATLDLLRSQRELEVNERVLEPFRTQSG